jgi:endonuclease/exonuclease/phosphatase family metal-dependent hydrolase
VVKLASFNLLSGRSLDDGLIDDEKLTAAIRALDADVLAVQEVDRGQARSHHADQPELVSRALGAVAGRFVATVDGTPGEPGSSPSPINGVDRPQYGIGIFSRRPVAEWHVLRLRPARGRFPLALPTRPPQVLWLPDEPRAAVALVLEEPRITVACTHLSFVPGVNALQLRAVRRWLEHLPGPRVLLGDLNLPAGLARRLTGFTPLVTAPTFPSFGPRMQLDHALASGLPAGSRVEGTVHERLPISDHRALEIRLELP